jgi:multicomponent Na+:H+ antiporter subunit C
VTLLLALSVAALFGSGAALMLERDLIRNAVGVILFSNALNLYIVASARTAGWAPIAPPPPDAPIADPLVQAMTLTAVVISFAVSMLVFTLIYAVYRSHRSIDQRDLRVAEEQEVEEVVRRLPPDEEVEATEREEPPQEDEP